MRKSLIITAFIMLLCLCGCEAVSPVLESSEPQRASETLLAATIAEAESIDELETTTISGRFHSGIGRAASGTEL